MKHDELSQNGDRLLKCIDAGLGHFGTNMKQVVYWELKERTGVGREDILARPKITSENTTKLSSSSKR